MGTLINMAAIFVGGVFGLLFGKAIGRRFQDILYQVCAVAVLFIGIAGALPGLLAVTEEGLSGQGTMMMLTSLILGALLGELLNIQGGIERLGVWLRKKSGSEGDNRFLDAFLTASLTVCVGAMAIVGALEDGLRGDPSILIAKAILDMIIIAVMSASMGKGCVFSLIPVGLLQGGVTALSGLIRPLITDAAMANLSCVGSILIFCVGVNLLWEKGIRVANLLPALLIAAGIAFL